MTERLLDAIFNLDVETVKNVIFEMTHDQILFHNPISYIMRHLISFSCSKTDRIHETINILTFYDFPNVYGQKIVSRSKLLSIIEIILTKCPELLKVEHLEKTQTFGSPDLLEIFRKYYFDENISENYCYVCISSTKNKDYIIHQSEFIQPH